MNSSLIPTLEIAEKIATTMIQHAIFSIGAYHGAHGTTTGIILDSAVKASLGKRFIY